MSDITIEIEGVEELQAKLSDPRLIGEPLVTLLEEASAIGRKTAEFGIDGGTGIAVRSINSKVKPLGTLGVGEMEAKVYTAIAEARAMSIEAGRSPGVPPRDILAQIIRWKEAVGHPDPAIVIAEEISRRGSKGKHFMQKAREVVAKELPQLVQKLGGRVEKRWEQKG